MLTEKIYAVSLYADEIILFVLLLASVISVAIILERYFFIRKYSNASQNVGATLQTIVHNNSIDDIEKIPNDPYSLEGQAAANSIKYLKERGSKGLEEFFNTFVITQRPNIERGMGFLATVGSNAPYVGLLGTVFGIMKAFRELSLAGNHGNSQVMIMEGISMALVATGAGLFVAIPAVIAYNFYNRKIKYIYDNLDALKEIVLAYAKQKGL